MNALIALALLAQQDAKELTKDWKAAWADFGVGSWVKFKVSAAGSESEETHKITRIQKQFVTVQVGDDEENHEETFFVGVPSEYDGKLTKLADEEVTVAGKAYKCAVYEITKSSGNTTQTLKIWKSADAPVWSVKEVFQSKTGRAAIGWTLEWTGEETLTIGGKSLTCRIFKKTTEAAGATTVETEWRNDEIPGRVAKTEARTSFKGQELASSTEIATAFEKK